MAEKTCPLRLMTKAIAKAAAAGTRAQVTGSTACPGPACAWFDAAAERCAVLTMARGTL